MYHADGTPYTPLEMERAAKRAKLIVVIVLVIWLSGVVGIILAAVISKINFENDRKKHMHGSGKSSGCIWNSLAEKKSPLLTALCSA